MSKYHNDNSYASDPGRLSLNPARFRRLEPSMQGLGAWFSRLLFGARFEAMLNEHLHLGDSRAACVVSIEPLLVAAYTDELDCVAMLSFPPWVVREFQLTPASRLLTVNTYSVGAQVVADLIPGPRSLNQYVNFYPVIADFVSDDRQRIDERVAAIADREWQHCETLGRDYFDHYPGRHRHGSPYRSFTAAT